MSHLIFPRNAMYTELYFIRSIKNSTTVARFKNWSSFSYRPLSLAVPRLDSPRIPGYFFISRYRCVCVLAEGNNQRNYPAPGKLDCEFYRGKAGTIEA